MKTECQAGSFITHEALLEAANLWAEARNQGIPTADPHALDADVILAAQVLTSAIIEQHYVVATTNVVHLSRFMPAEHWREISFEQGKTPNHEQN